MHTWSSGIKDSISNTFIAVFTVQLLEVFGQHPVLLVFSPSLDVSQGYCAYSNLAVLCDICIITYIPKYLGAL